MKPEDVARLALVFSVQAEIEGMKVANMERERNGYALAYDETRFFESAEALRKIATGECKILIEGDDEKEVIGGK